MKTKKLSGRTKLAAFLPLIAASASLAQPPVNTPHPRFGATKKSMPQETTANTSLGLALGAGSYPVLQLPHQGFTDARVDGLVGAEDLRTTKGALLDLRLIWLNNPHKNSDKLPLILSFGAQRMSSVTSYGINTPSTYMRLNTDAQLQYRFENLGLTLSPGIEARRSLYRNVESGHYVDALLLKTGVANSLTSTLDLGLNAGFAPVTRFGMMQPEASGKSGALSNSSVQMFEYATQLTWSPTQDTAFFANFSQENTIVSLNNSDGYRSYGLPITDREFGDSSKRYDLTVNQFTIGTSKRF